jgi:hypothetical protein
MPISLVNVESHCINPDPVLLFLDDLRVTLNNRILAKDMEQDLVHIGSRLNRRPNVCCVRK